MGAPGRQCSSRSPQALSGEFHHRRRALRSALSPMTFSGELSTPPSQILCERLMAVVQGLDRWHRLGNVAWFASTVTYHWKSPSLRSAIRGRWRRRFSAENTYVTTKKADPLRGDPTKNAGCWVVCVRSRAGNTQGMLGMEKHGLFQFDAKLCSLSCSWAAHSFGRAAGPQVPCGSSAPPKLRVRLERVFACSHRDPKSTLLADPIGRE